MKALTTKDSIGRPYSTPCIVILPSEANSPLCVSGNLEDYVEEPIYEENF